MHKTPVCADNDIPYLTPTIPVEKTIGSQGCRSRQLCLQCRRAEGNGEQGDGVVDFFRRHELRSHDTNSFDHCFRRCRSRDSTCRYPCERISSSWQSVFAPLQ